MTARLLLIDPDGEILSSDARDLEKSGFMVLQAADLPSARKLLDRDAIDLVLFALEEYGEGDLPIDFAETVSGSGIPLLFRADESRPGLLRRSAEISSLGYTGRSGVTEVLITTLHAALRRDRGENTDRESLRRDRELFNLFLENCPEYVFFKDDSIKTVKLSRNYEQMLGKPLDELLGKTMFDLFPSELGASMDADDRALLVKGEPFEVEEELNGRHYLTRKFPLKAKNNSSYLAGFTIDITRRVHAEQKLVELATMDALTGLFNRRHILHLGEMVLKDSIRAGVPLGIIMVDVDFFKNYNDTFGHQAGDECLISVTGIMSRVLSRNNDLIGRYGGEEFVAVLFNTDRESLQMLSEKLCQQVCSARIPHSSSTVSEFVTVSAGGVSLVPDEETSLFELIKMADTALYQAKTGGRNQAVIS